jgi:glycosyltransferase 2 family protein
MTPPTRRIVRLTLGYVFAFGALAWIFHDLSWSELHPVLSRIAWPWVAAAVTADIASYACQGTRWSLLLRPVGRVSPIRATEAIYAGLFVNELLPMRLGEVLRAWLVSRRIGATPAAIIPAIAVERLIDSLWVATAVAMAAVFVPLPGAWVRAGGIFGVLVGAALAIFVVLILRAPAALPAGAGRLRRFLAAQAGGIHAIGRSRYLLAASGISTAVLLLQGIAYWMVLRACGIDLGPGPGLVVFLVVHLGTAIPNAPGNVGAYQLFSVLGLALFGVAKAEAAAFSVAVFVLLTVPLWVLGWMAMSRSGLSLRGVRELLHRSPREGGLA